MAVPYIDPMPPAPSRASDTQTEFANKGDTFLAAMELLPDQQNTSADFINEKAVEADASATSAEQYAYISSSVANNKGEWSNASGESLIPASYSHNGKIWVQTVNIADISLSEPISGNSDWIEQVIQEDVNLRVRQTSSDGLGAAVIPTGDTSEEPAGSTEALFRFDTDLGRFRGYNPNIGLYGDIGGGGLVDLTKVDADFTVEAGKVYEIDTSITSIITATVPDTLLENDWFAIYDSQGTFGDGTGCRVVLSGVEVYTQLDENGNTSQGLYIDNRNSSTTLQKVSATQWGIPQSTRSQDVDALVAAEVNRGLTVLWDDGGGVNGTVITFSKPLSVFDEVKVVYTIVAGPSTQIDNALNATMVPTIDALDRGRIMITSFSASGTGTGTIIAALGSVTDTGGVVDIAQTSYTLTVDKVYGVNY